MVNLPILLQEHLASAKSLLAVSGGLDSIVLWHYLHVQGYSYGVVHCNFGLRAEESDEDEAFIQQIADQRKASYWCKRFDTITYAKKQNISLQEAARELRYAYFEELRQTQRFDYILTAHHADDQLETVLYHLIKGTSLTGLRGMKPQNGYLIRPLLQTTRTQIREYAQAHQLSWREDSSNQTDKYARNFIRHHLIPIGKQLNPAWETTFIRTAEKLASAENIVAEYVRIFKSKYVISDKEKITISKDGLTMVVEPVLVLYEILKPFGFHYQQVRNLINNPTIKTGKKFFSKTHVLYVSREAWEVCPMPSSEMIESLIQEDEKEIFIGNDVLRCETLRQTSVLFDKKDNWVACFDKSKLEFPLLIRRWRKGDRMNVLGLKGSKKVSDIVTDAKVSPAEKSHIFVLLSGEEIIWLVGFRMAETAKVTLNTSEIYQVTYQKAL